jgi:hypothetical protein
MNLYIRRDALESAREFFEDAGARGLEGTGMLAGQRVDGGDLASRFYAPDQRASAGPGTWVEVTERGKTQLALALAPGELWLARIHSHPDAAFHSPTDDANPAITAEGAWSIVVPFFGLGLRRGMASCALFVRREGRWVPVPPLEAARMVHVV